MSNIPLIERLDKDSPHYPSMLDSGYTSAQEGYKVQLRVRDDMIERFPGDVREGL